MEESNLAFAKSFNKATWDLLEKDTRTFEEDLLMIAFSFASLAHWLSAGTKLHQQRGYWLISRVYIEIGDKKQALFYAKICEQLTNENPELMKDFDIAYCHEGLARAFALNGDDDQAQLHLSTAEALGKMISDEEDRSIFQSDFEGGDWFGIKHVPSKVCYG